MNPIELVCYICCENITGDVSFLVRDGNEAVHLCLDCANDLNEMLVWTDDDPEYDAYVYYSTDSSDSE